VVNNGMTDEQYNIIVQELLFEKARSSIWSKEVNLEYHKEDIEYVNRPYIIFISSIAFFILCYISIIIIKGFGSLVAIIHQDDRGMKAFFSVVLSKKSNKDLAKSKKKLNQRIKNSARGGKYEREVRQSFYEHSMVFNETTFKSIPVGTYYVYLFGVITDAGRNDIGNYQMTQVVKIRRHQTHKLVFDLRHHTSQVNIQVFRGQEVAKGTEVTVKGQSESRYIKDDTGALFRLPAGRYTFIIHHEGKFFTEDVEITTLDKNFRFTFNIPVSLSGQAD